MGFVDDFILCGKDTEIAQTRDWVLSEFKKLGWFINFEKSDLEPSVEKQFIGYLVKTQKEKNCVCISIPNSRIRKLKKDIAYILKHNTATARGLARVAGQCVSMTKAVIPAKLLLRNLYRCLAKKKAWNEKLIIDTATRADLQWWHTALTSWNGKSFSHDIREVCIIESDASKEGWGARIVDNSACPGLSQTIVKAQGFWGWYTAHKSSNFRELKAVYLAILSFLPHLRGKTVHVRTDNICTAAYINFQGGPIKALSDIATDIWAVLVKNNIQIKASYIQGVCNVAADTLSRMQSQHEWMITPPLFQYLDKVWGKHTIDRFATVNTTQIETYNSRFADPFAIGIDALSQQDWKQHNNYVNPPIGLLTRVVDVIINQKATATVIAPMWQATIWNQKLRALSIAPPLKLPKVHHFVVQKGIRLPEPLKNKKWRWYAWRVSGSKI